MIGGKGALPFLRKALFPSTRRGEGLGEGACYSALMKTVAHNRRAGFDYEILDKVEAGIVLSGQEAKSCRLGHVNLAGSYVSFASDVPVLKSMKITKYPYASGLEDYDPGHDRVLLLSKTQIEKIKTASEQKGMTVVPLEVLAGKYIKVVIGIGRGRKRLDKRQHIKEREVNRRVRERGDA